MDINKIDKTLAELYKKIREDKITKFNNGYC